MTRQSLTPLTAGGRDDTPPGMSSLRKPNPGTVHPARYNPRASPTCRLRPAAGLASSSNDHTDEGVVNSPMFRTIQGREVIEASALHCSRGSRHV